MQGGTWQLLEVARTREESLGDPSLSREVKEQIAGIRQEFEF